MNEICIRKACKDDCHRLLELIKGLADFVNAPEEVTISLEHFTESGFGIHPIWWAFVAEHKGSIVGFALYFIRFSTWKGQRIYLEDLYIEPHLRRKGIGKLLFDRLIQEAKDRNISGIVWQALQWNENALNFYKQYNVSFDKEQIDCSLSLN